MLQPFVNRSPSYQFYPDKWESHTRHLSDYAYRVFHRLLNWMWMHADDYCSCPNDPSAIAVVLAEPCERIADALQELTNPHMRLLREEGSRLVSRGLQKEAEKQNDRKEKTRSAAKARWNNTLRDSDADAMQMQCRCNADAMQTVCSSSSSSSLLSKTERKKRKSKRFKKPSHDDVTQYAKSIGFELDGKLFVDFYEARGWLSGKTVIQDWKAAVRTWKRRRDVNKTAPQGKSSLPSTWHDPKPDMSMRTF